MQHYGVKREEKRVTKKKLIRNKGMKRRGGRKKGY
jgi:hypothetical protein